MYTKPGNQRYKCGMPSRSTQLLTGNLSHGKLRIAHDPSSAVPEYRVLQQEAVNTWLGGVRRWPLLPFLPPVYHHEPDASGLAVMQLPFRAVILVFPLRLLVVSAVYHRTCPRHIWRSVPPKRFMAVADVWIRPQGSLCAWTWSCHCFE